MPAAVGMKVITPGKIVPYKCCLSYVNVSVKKEVVLFN